jgi:CBS-domain-containing membrane protein
MLTTTKPLLELTASELMSRDLVTIPRQMSLRAAAHLLAQADITGAPVVDDEGRCVGMLSSTDVMHWVDREALPHREVARAIKGVLCDDWSVVDLQRLPAEPVCQFMTRDVVTSNPDTGIGELASRMIDAHIHRIVIADGQGRPVGIVSSTDILAAVAREGAMAVD